jgi:hypothetical protein
VVVPCAHLQIEVLRRPHESTQYTSIRFTEHLALEGIAPSVGTVGDAYDNALIESVIGLYKTECIATTVFHPGPYKTIADVEYATAGWVDWYTTAAYTAPSACSPQPSTSTPTTLLPTVSRNPHESGTEPVTVQSLCGLRRNATSGRKEVILRASALRPPLDGQPLPLDPPRWEEAKDG